VLVLAEYQLLHTVSLVAVGDMHEEMRVAVFPADDRFSRRQDMCGQSPSAIVAESGCTSIQM